MSNNGQHPAENIGMDYYTTTAEAKQDKNEDKATVAVLVESTFGDITGEKFAIEIESYHKSFHVANAVGGKMLNDVSKSKLRQKH